MHSLFSILISKTNTNLMHRQNETNKQPNSPIKKETKKTHIFKLRRRINFHPSCHFRKLRITLLYFEVGIHYIQPKSWDNLKELLHGPF